MAKNVAAKLPLNLELQFTLNNIRGRWNNHHRHKLDYTFMCKGKYKGRPTSEAEKKADSL